MIAYKRSNALHPERESLISLDLTPLLVFWLGFLTVRSLLRQGVSEQGAGERR